MNDDMRREFTVNGYTFGNASDVELAKSELSTARYIDDKIENRNADTILSVYQGALDRKMFRTPVGYSYLHDLQKRMLALGMERNKIPPIPLFQVFNNDFEESYEHKEREVKVNRKKKKDELRQKNRMLVLVNVILVFLIIVLFIISLNGSAPTILNYRNAIQNEYSAWEQELTERENAVREKERELQLD